MPSSLRLVLFASLIATAAIAAEPNQQESLPVIDRAARAKILRDEAAKLTPQIDALNELLKPLDAKAAELRKQMSAWSQQASSYQSEAARIESSTQPVQDPKPSIQNAASGLRATASAVHGVRDTIASYGGNAQEIDHAVRALGIDLGRITGALEQSGQALNTAASPEQIQAQIDKIEHDILSPLRDARKNIEQTRADAERRYRKLDPDVAKKNDEIRYWQAEREKHSANMEEAERRCAASAKVVLGVSVCTDLQSKAWFLQAQAGVAQADTAISLAQAEIARLELQRIGDAIALKLSTAAEDALDARIADVERQLQPLRDAKATLLAMRSNASKQELAKEKRALAAAASTKAASFKTEIDRVYEPLADKRKERDQLTKQRTSLTNQARLIEHPPRLRPGQKLG